MEWLFLTALLPYFFLLIRIYISLQKIRQYKKKSGNDIFVSVIVACRNEEKNIPFLLSDIVDQKYDPAHFELIIIDDNSKDSTYELALGFTGIKNIKVLRSRGRGKKKALRTGIEISSGIIVITTDADCRMGPEWIETIASFFISNKPDMIICPVKIEGSNNFFGRFQEIEFLALQGITAGTATDGNPVMCNGANLAFKKEVYIKYSGDMHEELQSGDDVFFLHNLKREPGSSILWLESPEAAVTTRAPEKLYSFLRQRARWISKSTAYNDSFTKFLAIVTFVTVAVQIIILAGAVSSIRLLLILGIYTALKSIPDFLILSNTTSRYYKRNLMRWFLPSLLIYPFYVLAVVIFSIVVRSKDSF